ncbi:MAG: hypothetical protein R8M45_08345, partial [Ghiorsea sp.]
MEAYEMEIERLVQSMDGETITNCSTSHAISLLTKMFNHASQSIRIFSGNLDFGAYRNEGLLIAMRDFLNSGKKLEIIIENDLDGKSDIADMIRTHKDKVSLLKLDGSKLESEPTFHFTLMDECSYRFEGDKTKHAAIAAFGDIKFAKKLDTAFTALR